MEYDFDREIDRKSSDSLKWRLAHGPEMIPMWVADMDFASPPCVIEAMHRRVDHGVFGYSVATDEVNQAVVDWARSHYGWQIDPRWIVWLPGLVPGLHVTCQTCAQAGEEVLAFVPVYPPILTCSPTRGRKVGKVPLVRDDRRWTIDIDRLESAITPNTRLVILCNPHNPVGRAFGRDELLAVAEVCRRHNVVVCSDEIHCDLILDDRQHVPYASLGEEIADGSITLMSPGKTFNTTGMNCGYAVIPNRHLRRHFRKMADGMVPHPTGLGYAACRAAYSEGEPWRRELIEYLRGNRGLIESFIAERLPMFSIPEIEATYLAWIDTTWLGKNNTPEFLEAAGVQLLDGASFDGKGFMRMNFGCPRATLQEALERIHRAVEAIG